MIIDRLENAHLYAGLSPRFAQAFDYLRHQPLDALPVGRVEIDGENLFAIVADGPTRLPSECRFEAHRRYHDIQLVTHGEELMGYADVRLLTLVEPFGDGDYAFFTGTGVDLHVRAGSFVVFMPHDGHRPSMAVGQPARVRKVVIKVAV